MKRPYLISTFILLVLTFSANAQIPDSFKGTWDWKSPKGELGDVTGTGFYTKDTIYVTFDGMSDVFPSEWVQFKSDTLRFNYTMYDTYHVTRWVILTRDSTSRGKAESEAGQTEIFAKRRKD